MILRIIVSKIIFTLYCAQHQESSLKRILWKMSTAVTDNNTTTTIVMLANKPPIYCGFAVHSEFFKPIWSKCSQQVGIMSRYLLLIANDEYKHVGITVSRCPHTCSFSFPVTSHCFHILPHKTDFFFISQNINFWNSIKEVNHGCKTLSIPQSSYQDW